MIKSQQDHGGHCRAGTDMSLAHAPCVQIALWQSAANLHVPFVGHLRLQVPPHLFPKSLGVQHFWLMQAKCSQSLPVVQPCPSSQ